MTPHSAAFANQPVFTDTRLGVTSTELHVSESMINQDKYRYSIVPKPREEKEKKMFYSHNQAKKHLTQSGHIGRPDPNFYR